MIVKLSRSQFEYLASSLFEDQRVSKLKRKDIRKENQSIIVEVDEATADEIRDWATEQLHKKGFNINYQLTDKGKILEELIDTFYTKQ